MQLMGIVEGGKCVSQSAGGKQRNANSIHNYLAAKISWLQRITLGAEPVYINTTRGS